MKKSKEKTPARRDFIPFKVIDSEGRVTSLEYSSPLDSRSHKEMKTLGKLPWFDSGKPLRNWMLHEIDFYDEVEKIWGKKWGAEGIGRLKEVLVSRPTENETREEYSKEWQFYYSSSKGNANLSKLQEQFDEYYRVLKQNGVRVNYVEPPLPAIGAYGYLKNMVTLAGAGLVVKGGAIIHRMGLGSWQRGREVIWTKALAALQVPIYLTIHGKGVGEPGAGRWLDSKTFVFNESVVANEQGLAQLQFILSGLGKEFVVTHSPGWVETIGNGNVGTSHADMFMMVPDIGICVLAPGLVNYAFVRYLKKRKIKIIEVPPEEYWDLAVNAVTLSPGRVVMNAGSKKVVRALEKEAIEVIQVDFSESHKFAIAGLHCATLELVREQPGPLLKETEQA
ncbi:MAG TPA: arginine deiminase family protein [Nitrososphaerales archaeon]|nr:arginine deiminase family protein [Nitrososphaerales archaeon]